MVAQDMTKFTLVVVLLGVVLAIAIFRPQILSAPPTPVPSEPAPTASPSGGNPSPGETQPAGSALLSQVSLDSRAAELNARETTLNDREGRLRSWEDALKDQERLLAEQASSLQDEESNLAEQRAVIQSEQDRLDQEKEALQVERARLNAEGTHLAEEEQRIGRLLRWSVVAAALSGLAAVPSVLVLVALARRGWSALGRAAKQTAPSQTRPKEQASRHTRPTIPFPTPVYGGNGRNKETVSSIS
jgi:hypothetical protein